MEKSCDVKATHSGGWEGKDKILVQALGGGEKSDFYIVDLRGNELMKLPGLWNYGGGLGALVAMGPVLYAIGGGEFRDDYDPPPRFAEERGGPGADHVHTGTSFLDLTDGDSKKWSNFAEMNCERWAPNCAALDTKIYALGGSPGDLPVTFGEVYDTAKGADKTKKKNKRKKKKKQQLWTAMPLPPFKDLETQCNMSTPVISDPDHNRLFVYFGLERALYAHYPQDGKWVCHDKGMIWQGVYAPTPVKGLIYSYVDTNNLKECLIAYDIATKKCLDVSWTSFFDPVHKFYNYEYLNLVHLGDDMLCLPATCLRYDPTTRHHTTTFQFFRFSVHRVSAAEVRVTPVSAQGLTVDGFCSASYFVPI